ncbi:MAG: 50S ribosomal protein L31e [Nanoarchaeota archaeon]|nr:50S ribosomal protein L31e [Nanoarchaeota archaeon]MBU4124213.1 50S ribosomal protein L31e [Nanoarchaeota archaeon]
MAEEKIFTIPLRKAYRTVARNARARKAIDIIRAYLQRHMKCENVKIGFSINNSVWARGIQKPPRKIRIHAKLDSNAVLAELVGVDIKTLTAEEAKEKAKKKEGKKEKIKEERKERKKQTIQEEIKEESGKPEAPTKPEISEPLKE